MSPALARFAIGLVSCSIALALAGCGEPAAPTPAPSAPKTTDAKPPAPAPSDAKPPAPTDVEPPAPAPAPTPAPAGEEWLVWFERDGQWVTRWIDATATESTLVAERQALVLSDGTKLWRLERKDGEERVLPCECQPEEDYGAPPPGCKPHSRLASLGLQAVELVGGAVVSIREAHGGDLYGDGISRSLDIVGGVGSRLFHSWGEGGFMCGAHGMIEGENVVFDLATAKPVPDPFTAVGRALPAELREPAGREIQASLKECDGDDAPTVRQVLDEEMDLVGVSMGLAKGVPEIGWTFEAPTYYMCSPDYGFSSTAQSGFQPAAAPLGLDGPLPGGVMHALASMGTTPTVGWARLKLTGEARQAALAAFRSAPEPKWPPSEADEQPVASDPEARGQARAKLDEGRRLTRAGDYATAITTYDAAIELDAALARAWSERGYAKLLAGDLEGARADLEAALPLDEGAAYRAAVHYNLGQVAERSGDAKAAKTAYETSLALRDNETVRKALAKLR